jgi:uncharacterized phage protein gp47/JayE
MASQLFQFAVKDPATIRDDILRTLRSALIARGVPSPNVGPDSDEYVRATAVANELAVVEANAVIKTDALMPDTATGTDLDVRMATYGLTRRAAAPSTGNIVLSSTAATLVPTGAQLVDGAGLVYKVATGGTYASGASIPIIAVSTGSGTNHAAGDSLSWQAAPAYSAPTALVDVGGLVNGGDAEDDETARARLLARIQTPPRSGNWQHVADIIMASHPSVQYAFVYPAIQGGATVHAAVTASPTSSSKSRDLASTTLVSTVVPYTTGALPEHVALTLTTVTNQPTDVAIGLALPASQAASPPGPGGGWLDAVPWPTAVATGYVPVVGSPTSTTSFAVAADNYPAVGTRIAWLSPITWTLYTATVVSVVALSYPITITIDTPWPGLVAGGYIFPQAVNTAAYVAAWLQAMALMGPGEKSTNASALIRGFRHPTPNLAWPYKLGPTQLRALSNVGPEVLDVSYLSRSNSIPTVPGAVTSAPYILTPNNFGLYPL